MLYIKFLALNKIYYIIVSYSNIKTLISIIKNIKNLSTGKLLTLYCLIRQIAGAMSLRISGHPQFVRPLINPMAQGAAISKYGEIDKKYEDKIKAAAASMDNYGNFYGQNLFLASSGVLLISNTLSDLGYATTGLEIAKASVPVAVIAFILVIIQNIILDKQLERTFGKRNK